MWLTTHSVPAKDMDKKMCILIYDKYITSILFTVV